jgi:hypothetical protein
LPERGRALAQSIETVFRGASRSAGNLIDPNKLHFIQSSASTRFRDSRFSDINTLANALKGPGGDRIAATMEPVRVFVHEGKLFTLDHRRVLAFALAGRPIPYRLATPAEIEAATKKFTATVEQLGGWYIRVVK